MTPILIALTAISVVAWAALLTTLAIRTRNPVVQPGPATAELGPESPPVVDLITGGWRLCDEAASATVLDLAARGLIGVEEVGPELSLVRLKPGARSAENLAPYELMVYDHLRSLAGGDGVVAAGALAEGNRDAGRLWRSFRRKVVREARARGLSRPRWTTAEASLVSGAALVPSVMAGLTILALADGDSVQAAFGGGFITWVILSGALKLFSGERGTPEGARAASRWMGVREHLAGGGFEDQPPAAVTIYGRHFAYAATLGLAHRAVAGLPISKEADDRRAWSDYGGLWRPVEVRYPGMPRGFRRRPFFWGRGPVFGLLVPLLFAGFTMLFLLGPLLAATVALGSEPTLRGVLIPAALIAAGLYLVPFARACVDLGPKQVIQGQVVRLRHFVHKRKNHTTHAYWIAVDDGRHDKIKAYMLSAAMFSSVREGDTVRMTAGRGLGWVYGLDVLSRTDRRPADHHETRQFPVRRGVAAALADSLIARAAAAAGPTTLLTAADPALLGLGASRVPGIREEARLGPGVVCVRSGRRTVAIAVVSPRWGPPPPERLTTLARIAASRMS